MQGRETGRCGRDRELSRVQSGWALLVYVNVCVCVAAWRSVGGCLDVEHSAVKRRRDWVAAY